MPLLWLSLAFLTGLVLSEGLVLGWTVWAGLTALCVGLGLLEGKVLARFQRYARLRAWVRLPLCLVLAAVMASGLRQALAHPQPTPGDLAWYNDTPSQRYRLTGVVSAPPDAGSTVIEIEARSIAPLDASGKTGGTTTVSGKLQATLLPGAAYRYGDLLELDGSPTSLAGQARQDWLVHQGFSATLDYPRVRLVQHGAGDPFLASLYDLREAARGEVLALLPMPESALLVGILLGIDSDLPAGTAQAFQATGTAHIWAISGFNIAIVSGLLLLLLGRLLPHRRLAAALLAITAITAYTLMVGANPSVVRAAIMGTVGMFGPLLGRRQVGINSLAFTAAAMSLFDPNLPWSTSFQLSFMATLGLVAFGEPFQNGFERLLERRLPAAWSRRIAGPVGEYFLLTLAAQLTTLPITAIQFHRFSLSAALANPLVLPVQSLVMVLGGLALLGGAIFFPLGQLLAALAWPLLAYTIRMVELLAQIPGGTVVGLMDLPLGLLFYAGLALLALGLYLPAFFRRWLRPAVLLVVTALLAGAVWRAALAAPDGRLHLSAFNVGGQPAVLLRAPQGQYLLVNGGADETRLADELGRRLLPFEPRLDAWLVTLRSNSPLEGMLALAGRYAPAQAILSSQTPDSKARQRLLEAYSQAGVTADSFEAGQSIDLGSGASLKVLADTKDGTAVLLEWQGFRALLPGGVKLKDLEKADLAGITALVLGPADLESENADTWSALGPAAVLWQRSGALIDAANWLNLSACRRVDLTTDGKNLWTEISN
jgi:competence protein ComEC